MNLNKAQMITQKTDGEFRKNVMGVKWTDVYKSESEIIEDLKKVHIPEEQELWMHINLYSGWSYIHSFARAVQSGKELTDKQMTQCKRLALEIKKAARIADCY